jgi:hypothetical protein
MGGRAGSRGRLDSEELEVNAVTVDQMRHAHYVDELRRDIHRALKSARRRDHWMQKARRHKAEGFIDGVRLCVKYARELNHDAQFWAREAILDMRQAR